MKKIVLALTLMVTPLTIQAQEQKQEVSDHIIQEAVKEFVPAFCNGVYPGFADAVAHCYLSTDENSPEIEKCMLGDLDLATLVRESREKANKLGLDDPAKDITFVSQKSWGKRFNHYFNIHKFKNMNGKEIRDYFGKGEDIMDETVINTCNKH